MEAECTYGRRPDICACGERCQYLQASRDVCQGKPVAPVNQLKDGQPPVRSPWTPEQFVGTLPNGLPNAPKLGTNPKDLLGVKKVDLSLVPAIGIWHEACAFLDGGIEYGPYNWRDNAVLARVYIAAARRHLDDYEARLDYTGDTDVHSLGAARACMGILLDAEMSGNLIDDRPKSASSAFAAMTAKLNAWAKARVAKGRYRNV